MWACDLRGKKGRGGGGRRERENRSSSNHLAAAHIHTGKAGRWLWLGGPRRIGKVRDAVNQPNDSCELEGDFCSCRILSGTACIHGS